MTRLPRTAFIGLAAALGVAAAGSASAATLAALQDGKTIVWIDTDQKKVIGKVGLDGGASLVGFDVRPADGKLYGLTRRAPSSRSTSTGQMGEEEPTHREAADGATYSVHFNPAADRLRVMSTTRMSYRINVEDGKTTVDGTLKYADADAMKGKTPQGDGRRLFQQLRRHQGDRPLRHRRRALARWSSRRRRTTASSTPSASSASRCRPRAFDVWSDGKGANTGWLLADGTLFRSTLPPAPPVPGQGIGPERQN